MEVSAMACPPGNDLYVIAVCKVFWIALAIFTAGSIYRISKLLLRWRRVVKAGPRRRGAGRAIIGLIETFLDPIIFSAKTKPHDFLAGLVALHILGVIPLIFLLGHHVVFFSYWFKPYSVVAKWGIWIPLSATSSTLELTSPIYPASTSFTGTIWGPLAAILNGDLLAILAIIGVAFKLGMKIIERAEGLQHMRWSDFFSLGLLLFILATGYMAARHHALGEATVDVETYRTLLALHILGAETLLALLPFSKFWHFVFGYWYGKLHEWYDVRVQKGLV
jgi:nitrate reductase gamma subunit